MKNDLILKKQRHIHANPQSVWNVLIAPTTVWPTVTIHTKSEWKQNSDIIFSFVWDGVEYADRGKVIEIEPEKLLIHSFWSAFSGLPDAPENYSVVKYQLTVKDEETILDLTHSNFATDLMYEHSDKNWEETLNKIKQEAEAVSGS